MSLYFPIPCTIGFRDTTIYNGSIVHFYKRAQILVGDLWAAYGRPTYVQKIYIEVT